MDGRYQLDVREERREGGDFILHLSGELEIATAPQVRAALARAEEFDPASRRGGARGAGRAPGPPWPAARPRPRPRSPRSARRAAHARLTRRASAGSGCRRGATPWRSRSTAWSLTGSRTPGGGELIAT